MQPCGWYGGPEPYVWKSRQLSSTNEMTAIVTWYTGEKFIVAADGRCKSDDPTLSGGLETEYAQKIFPVEDAKLKAAWSITGFALNEDGTFDLVAECKKIVKTLPMAWFSNSNDYVDRFCLNLRRVFGKARRMGISMESRFLASGGSSTTQLTVE